jgi:DNA-binding response OmpR family regulator
VTLKVLYFDDEKNNIDKLNAIINSTFQVIGCTNPSDFDACLRDHFPQVVLIDTRMPEMNGFDLYAKITEHSHYNGCPVIFISREISREEKILALNMGGLDCIEHEMSPEEIKIRIVNKARLYLKSSLKLSLGNLTMDFELLEATLDGEPLDLTLVEMRILGLLFRNHPCMLSRQELVRMVWSQETVKLTNIDVHISSLRNKLKNWNHSLKIRDEKVLIEANS